MAPSSPHAQGAAPRYEFDASWNRPFPNRWINGGLGGLCVDANDHVLVLNRQDVNKPELAAGGALFRRDDPDLIAGKPTQIRFWRSWMPSLNPLRLREEYASRGQRYSPGCHRPGHE